MMYDPICDAPEGTRWLEPGEATRPKDWLLINPRQVTRGAKPVFRVEPSPADPACAGPPNYVRPVASEVRT